MRLPLLALIALLALPTAAAAKELTALDVCGTDGCTRITEREALDGFMRSDDLSASAPKGPQRSYVLRTRITEGEGESAHGWTTRWLPAAGLMAYEDPPGEFNFTSVDPALEKALRRAARGHTARAARAYAPKVEPTARVSEVFTPAASAERSAASDGDDDGGLPPLAWVGVAAGLLLVGGATARAQIRHKRP
jgi:hypothetical protein